ncbi:MAG: YfhO family protein [Lachnospiraceae bacterium]|jgi:uncharacterized membrane protein YfhO
MSVHFSVAAVHPFRRGTQKAVKEKKKIPFLKRRIAPCLIAFAITFAAMLVIFMIDGIYPFGDRSFLRTDLYHQYAPFFQEYKRKLANGESLFFTWNIGLGTNFLSLYAYYLSSPINWLLILWPRSGVIEFITYGIVLRMSLSSATMTFYLDRRNPSPRLSSALFGIFYGLSGYMAAYSWNIMWLDCIFLFPLIICGLEDLILHNKGLLYCITLALCIYSNYYISIMVCLSVVLFFAAMMVILEPEDNHYIRKVLFFFLYSLLAGGIAGIMLMPEVAALSTTASGNITFPQSFTSYFSILEMLGRHLMNTAVEIGLDHWPNIYCGVGVLIFIPLFATSRRIPFREKAACAFLIIFYLLSFSLNKLNFIWHGFHYPNSLPCRQSFAYIFLIIAMSYKAFRDVKNRSGKDLTLAVAFALIFIAVEEQVNSQYTYTELNANNDQYYVWYSFYLSILFVLIYGILTRAWMAAKKYWKKILICAAVASVFLESTINMLDTSVTTVSRSVYVKDDETVRSLISEVNEAEGGDLVREERVSNRTKNDGAWFNYHSISIFSSMANAKLTAFYKCIGMESSTNAYGSTGQSWPALMLLGVKYSISMSALNDDESLRTLFDSKDGVYVYRNTYALPIGFAMDTSLETEWSTADVNPAVNWNSLSQELTGKDLFIEQTNVSNNVSPSVSIVTSDPGYVYIYSNKAGSNKVSVTYNGVSKTWDNLNRSYFITSDSSLDAGTIITVTSTDDTASNVTLNAYVMDEDVLAEMYDALSEEPLQITAWSSTSLEGTIETSSAKTLFLSIPYDSGWTAEIDGKPVAVSAWKDTFLSIAVPEGTHTVTLKYTPNGFRDGALLSLICIALLILIEFLRKTLRENGGPGTHRKAAVISGDDAESEAVDELASYGGTSPGGSGPGDAAAEPLTEEESPGETESDDDYVSDEDPDYGEDPESGRDSVYDEEDDPESGENPESDIDEEPEYEEDPEYDDEHSEYEEEPETGDDSDPGEDPEPGRNF